MRRTSKRLALAAHLGEELLANGVRVRQQVDRHEGGRPFLARRLLLRVARARLSLRSVRFELRALVAPSFFRFFRMRSAVLAAALPASSSSESAALAWSCAPSRKRSAMMRSAECGCSSERARHHVDRARVAPDVPAAADEHAQRVLGRHDRAVAEHREDARLQPLVGRVVLVLGVDALDVGDDVRVQALAQDLVAAAEAAEAEPAGEGLVHPVPQQHQRLEDGAAHGRLQRVELLVEERGRRAGTSAVSCGKHGHTAEMKPSRATSSFDSAPGCERWMSMMDWKWRSRRSKSSL